MQVVSVQVAGRRFLVLSHRRKYPLPNPLAIGVRIFLLESIWECNVAALLAQIFFMPYFDFLKVLFQPVLDSGGEDGNPVLTPLP